MSDALESLNGLIVPMAAEHLLLPNVAVAELVAYRLSFPASGGPDWFLGWSRWRDQLVPTIDPERLLGQPEVAGERAHPRSLIINGVSGQAGLSFLALRVWGIPRSRKVLRGEIDNAGPAAPYVLQPVQLAEEAEVLLIPDSLAIERTLVESGLVRQPA